MRRIMLLNTKGGSGKSMLATTLASYYAGQGKKVALADLDPQGSSIAWLESRSEDESAITGIQAWNGSLRTPRATEYLILDTPAGGFGKLLTAMVRRADTVIVPVQPSPVDMRAAARFIHDLLEVGKVSRKQTRVALVANRCRENTGLSNAVEKLLGTVNIGFSTPITQANDTLEDFLESMKVPFVAKLSDSENYAKADASGRSIFDLAPAQVMREAEQWQPLIEWLKSRRSQPVKKRAKKK